MTRFIKRSINKNDTILRACQKWKIRASDAAIRNEQAHNNKCSGNCWILEAPLQRNIDLWCLPEWISNKKNIKILKDVRSGMARYERLSYDHVATEMCDFWRTSAAKCWFVKFNVSLSSSLKVMNFDRRPQWNPRLLEIPDVKLSDQARANETRKIK